METLKQMTTFDDILICKISAGENGVKTKRPLRIWNLLFSLDDLIIKIHNPILVLKKSTLHKKNIIV